LQYRDILQHLKILVTLAIFKRSGKAPFYIRVNKVYSGLM